jgi:hypothetical protein
MHRSPELRMRMCEHHDRLGAARAFFLRRFVEDRLERSGLPDQIIDGWHGRIR